MKSSSASRSPGYEEVLTDGHYRAVFEASPDAMLVVDSSGVIRDLNPQAVSMFGWSREEMEGSGVERLIPAASRSRHERHRMRYAEAPRPRPMGQGLGLQALRKDGTTFPVEISLSPGKLASGPEHVICTIRDITSWKRMRWLSRMKLKAAENERKHLSRELHDEFLQFLVAFKIRGKLLVADELDPVAVLGLYRIVQAAVTNAATHAGVSEAAVTVRSEDGVIVAEVRDEGCGFELTGTGAAEDDGHVGLAGMRERAQLAGGSLTVRTSPGRGTTVRATVPMVNPDREQR